MRTARRDRPQAPRRPWVDILFAASFVGAAAGLLALALGPYTGLSLKPGGDAVFLEAPRPGSPAASLWLAEPRLAGARLLSIADQGIGPRDIIEDPDYLGDASDIKGFFGFQGRLWAAYAKGQGLALRCRGSGGEEFSVNLRPAQMGFGRALYRSALMLFLGAFSVVVGYLLARRRPEDGNARRFFLMCLSVMLIFSSFGLYTARDLILQPGIFSLLFYQNTLAFAGFFVLFPLFFLNFPREMGFMKRPAVKPILGLLALLALGLSASRVFGGLSNILFLGGLLIGLAGLCAHYVKAASATERYQIRWIFWGTLAFVLVFLGTAILPSLVLGRRLVSDRVPSLFFALIPLSIVFAIEKYHLMDIDRLFDSSLAYLLSLLAFSALDILVFWLLNRLSHGQAAFSALMASLVACWGFLLVYNPLRAAILAALRRLFGRRQIEPVAALERLSTGLAGLGEPSASGEESLGRASERFMQFLSKEFDPQRLCLRLELPRPEGGTERLDFGNGPEISTIGLPEAPLFLRQLILPCPAPEMEDDVVVPILKPRLDDLVSAADSADGVETTEGADSDPGPGARVGAGMDRCLGYAILGPRRSRRLYSGGELSLLGVLAGEFALRLQVLMDIRREELAELRLARERERMARDIHDGLGSALSLSLLMAGRLQGLEGQGGEGQEGLAELRRVLEGALTELRSLVWTMSGDADDCLALTADIRSRLLPPLESLGFSCRIGLPESLFSTRLGPGVRLQIYRLCQEALANCAKYREPGGLSLDFSFDKEGLRCRFRCASGEKDPREPRLGIGGGMGLENMERRVGELGARLLRGPEGAGPWDFDLILPPGTSS